MTRRGVGLPGGRARGKRAGSQIPRSQETHVSAPVEYSLPEGPIGLKGPVARVAPGTLPLRGDLAHIALAGRYLAAHYVVPQPRTVGLAGATLHVVPRDEGGSVVELAAGSPIEALDYAGDWCWASCGPEGPSGYLRIARLAPDAAAP
jgi:hypothetical protein